MGEEDHGAWLAFQKFNERARFLAAKAAKIISTQVKGHGVAVARVAYDR
jgi:hypothetical protein